MAALGTFLRKYWILIVIVLWVIAWFNRDWLAGTTPGAEDVQPADEVISEVAALAPAPEPAAEAEPARVTEPVVEPEPVATPEPAAQMEPVSDPQPAAVEAAPVANGAAGLIASARAVQRDRGPRAAAEVLAEGLRELPADTPELPDLYGELGNFHFLAGNFAAALSAYDSAVKALPEAERAAMLRRLAPIYDRFHPQGRSHLEQFR